jgi:hypothetical protein
MYTWGMNVSKFYVLSCLLSVLFLLPSCGKEEKKGGNGGAFVPSSGSGSDPEGKRETRENRVIQGVVLENLPGKEGEFFRNEKKQQEAKWAKQGWFQPVSLDLGEISIGKVAHGVFKFRNPTGKDQVIQQVSSSCVCQKLVLNLNGKLIPIRKENFQAISIPANAEGSLTIDVAVTDVSKKLGEVMIRLSDPDVPVVRLRIQTVGVDEFQVSHDGKAERSYWLGTMTVHQSQKLRFDVRSRDKKAFLLKMPGELPKGLNVQIHQDPKDPAHWTIEGMVGPGLPTGPFSKTIEFPTDRGASVTIGVDAMVAPKFVVEPGYLPLVMIPKKKGKSATITVRSLDPKDSFQIERAAIEDLKLRRRALSSKGFQLKTEVRKPGNEVILTLVVPAGLEPGPLEGGVKIYFKNGEGVRLVRFVGFVR